MQVHRGFGERVVCGKGQYHPHVVLCGQARQTAVDWLIALQLAQVASDRYEIPRIQRLSRWKGFELAELNCVFFLFQG
jgi:hypothetical protein